MTKGYFHPYYYSPFAVGAESSPLVVPREPLGNSKLSARERDPVHLVRAEDLQSSCRSIQFPDFGRKNPVDAAAIFELASGIISQRPLREHAFRGQEQL